MIAGRLPFEAEHEAAIAYSIAHEEPEPLARYKSGVSDELQRIVSKCLVKRSDERFQSAADLLGDLKRLYRSIESGAIDSDPGEAESRPSIAVLPFVNMSDDRDNEYFSDGLTEELINALVKIPDLHVAARTSCFQFKGKTGDIDSIGRQLKVALVLEGSVRKAGGRVRITAQLVNVSDGFHLWSETYDRDLEDIFAVQDDISHSVAETLKVVLVADHEAAVGARVANVEVHNLLLEALHFFRQGKARENLEKALACYKRVIEIAPDCAEAWAGLSNAYLQMPGEGDLTVRACVENAREAIERALALDDSMAEAHRGLGGIRHYYDLDWQGAEAEYQRALELEPGNASAIRSAGRLAYSTGRLDEAISLLSRGVALDPLNAAMHIDLGWSLFCSNRLDEAVAAYQRGLELEPARPATHHFLGRIYLIQGRAEAALQEMQREPHDIWRFEGEALAYHMLDRQELANKALGELLSHSHGWQFNIAEVYAFWSDLDRAFEWLERARSENDGGVGQFTKTDPLLWNLHGDPRWGAFLAKIGLAD
jgi:TolB-like protein/Tfp pilus assembly protein PilF